MFSCWVRQYYKFSLPDQVAASFEEYYAKYVQFYSLAPPVPPPVPSPENLCKDVKPRIYGLVQGEFSSYSSHT